MDCKTLYGLKRIIFTTNNKQVLAIATSTLNTLQEIDESNIQPTDITIIQFMVEGLMSAGHLELLGDIHSDPDCAICIALSNKLLQESSQSMK